MHIQHYCRKMSNLGDTRKTILGLPYNKRDEHFCLFSNSATKELLISLFKSINAHTNIAQNIKFKKKYKTQPYPLRNILLNRQQRSDIKDVLERKHKFS